MKYIYEMHDVSIKKIQFYLFILHEISLDELSLMLTANTRANSLRFYEAQVGSMFKG